MTSASLRSQHGGTASFTRVPGLSRLSVGQAYGALLVVLLLASKVDVRMRDASLALQGVTDTQILAEMAIWSAAGLWIAVRLLRPRRWLMHAFPGQLGPAMQWYCAIALTSVLSALLLRGSALPVVRAGQLLVMVALAVLIQRDVRWGHASLAEVWTSAARLLTLAVIAMMALGLLLPQLTSDYTTYYGYSRYRLLQMHPIGSAQLMGLALLLAGTDLLVRLRRSTNTEQVLLALGCATLAGGIWATKARGALGATVVALVVVALLTPEIRRRGAILIMGTLAAVPVVAGVFDDALRTTLLRGQTEEQLLSLTGRTELFSYAWQLFAEKPLTGHGYLAARGIFLERFPWAGESHNAVVDIAMSLGLMGLVLYAGLFVAVVVPLSRALSRRGMPRKLAVAGTGLLTWLLLDGVGSDSYGGAVGAGIAALILSAVIADELRGGQRKPLDPRGRAV